MCQPILHESYLIFINEDLMTEAWRCNYFARNGEDVTTKLHIVG